MGKYFIKKHCVGTERLTLSIHNDQTYYYGNKPLGGYVSKHFSPASFEVEQYGFNSVEEAKVLFLKMLPAVEAENSRGQWKTTLEIVEVG